VLAAAAVVGVAAAGFGVGWLARPVPDPPPLEPVAVQVAETGIEASADVIPHTWGRGGTSGRRGLHGRRGLPGRGHRRGRHTGSGRPVPRRGPAELRCNLNSSVLREDATGFEVVAADGTVVASSEL
jgi:hypothetical protein